MKRPLQSWLGALIARPGGDGAGVNESAEEQAHAETRTLAKARRRDSLVAGERLRRALAAGPRANAARPALLSYDCEIAFSADSNAVCSRMPGDIHVVVGGEGQCIYIRHTRALPACGTLRYDTRSSLVLSAGRVVVPLLFSVE